MHNRYLTESIYTGEHFTFLGKKEAFLSPRAPYQKRSSQNIININPLDPNGQSNTFFVEIQHIDDLITQKWFDNLHDGVRDRHKNLDLLTDIFTFETLLHKRFPGAKRFSIEGTDALIPGLEALVQKAKALSLRHIVIGMSHRGRLDVLACLFKKPYKAIFEEFDDDYEGIQGIAGDVKYHNGYVTQHDHLKLTLLNNPSHLESISPIVLGYCKGVREKTLPLIIHGDGAFSGQGIVYETFQLGGISGYNVGGAIHVIVDNQIAFTTTGIDGRSTHFCSDLAKAFQVPIFHVNADDVDAVCFVFEMALLFREQFQKDALIRLIGYRRYGHNEGDEPSFTHPQMYKNIQQHVPVHRLYAQKHQLTIHTKEPLNEIVPPSFPEPLSVPSNLSSLSVETLKNLLKDLLTVPSNFTLHPKIAQLHKHYLSTESCTWAMGEILAFTSLLYQGHDIRLSGQDSCRGTFSHRHAVWFDQVTGEAYYPFGANFTVLNSPLSEYGVLGFEYGYSLAKPRDLVIWEAQFGDFANGAQIIIDQYLSSSFMKWGIVSPLVLMLPHGLEGQGPEHSSARLERFLQMSAQNNWVVANVTTPANLYHLLRCPRTCPLILMTPKSLLRHKKAISPWEDFTHKFQEIYGDLRPLKRAIFCTGKIYYDLLDAQGNHDVSLIRLEQLYPFPAESISKLPVYKEVFWVQEEPENMGAWTYIKPYFEKLNIFLQYKGRPPSSTPATGYYARHTREQREIIKKAFEGL